MSPWSGPGGVWKGGGGPGGGCGVGRGADGRGWPWWGHGVGRAIGSSVRRWARDSLGASSSPRGPEVKPPRDKASDTFCIPPDPAPSWLCRG